MGGAAMKYVILGILAGLISDKLIRRIYAF